MQAGNGAVAALAVWWFLLLCIGCSDIAEFIPRNGRMSDHAGAIQGVKTGLKLDIYLPFSKISHLVLQIVQ